LKRFVRYVIVGLLVNLFGYVIYILMTNLWDQPKTVMSIQYMIGLSTSFYFNRRWTFQYSGSIRWDIFKYILAHFFGYLFNLVLLILFVDHLGYPHQLVQAGAIFAVALFLFAIFNFLVFPKRPQLSHTI
jgi:putative flippase GtrA